MKRIGSRSWGTGAPLVVAAGLALTIVGGIADLGAQQAGLPLPASPPAVEVKRPLGDAEISVVLSDGKKFTSCSVYARNQSFQPASAEEKILAVGLPAEERIAVTADARVGTGDDAVRYVGVAETTLDEGKVKKVKVTLKPVKDIDLFCRECHPDRAVRSKRGQIVRDIHVSGKRLEGRYLDQVAAYNAKVETLRREGKPAGEPLILDERIIVVAGKKVKQIFYTCESCHTLHASTDYRRYARADFLSKSDLCIGCHY